MSFQASRRLNERANRSIKQLLLIERDKRQVFARAASLGIKEASHFGEDILARSTPKLAWTRHRPTSQSNRGAARLAEGGGLTFPAQRLRPAPRGQERLREAAKLGFTRAIIPRANAPKQRIDGIEIMTVDRVEQALSRLSEIE